MKNVAIHTKLIINDEDHVVAAGYPNAGGLIVGLPDDATVVGIEYLVGHAVVHYTRPAGRSGARQ